VEYNYYLAGSPHKIGTANLMESFISSLETMPGTI